MEPTREKRYKRRIAELETENAALAITPVLGGVGPMTITMLMLNTLQAAQRSVG